MAVEKVIKLANINKCGIIIMKQLKGGREETVWFNFYCVGMLYKNEYLILYRNCPERVQVIYKD